MKRILAIATLSTALLAPQAASAKIVELGGAIPKAAVSCPENCQAVGRVTGYQGRGGTVAKPFVIPRKGKIIAFTVRLGKPDANQVKFFNDLYGNDPQVQLSILRRGDKQEAPRWTTACWRRARPSRSPSSSAPRPPSRWTSRWRCAPSTSSR